MVWETCQAVKIPVIGVGGISSASDALEFLIAGATAIQVGTANFYNPAASQQIALGLENYCRTREIDDIRQLIGSLQV
jgi:dihydroorotate dehydrogenase (NAD+) catalytic subunit